ncbi:hypothetical protein QR680_005669 [Steinernema hermaphroditum]|uniref:DUF19 domain-containing protein n=1 Tax=Steinernema hermaphroditum TaxID=289476 RepID=A0AA39HU05_9BILA|nr:hypothetical protein QR680_005669 [Steinernema hermaphroditum]
MRQTLALFLLFGGAVALLSNSFFDRTTECDLSRFKSCYKTFVLRSLDDAKNGVDEKTSTCRWQQELDTCLGKRQAHLCMKETILQKVFRFSKAEAADHIAEYGILKFKCGEGRDLWLRHAECLTSNKNSASLMEEVAKCASRKNLVIFFRSLLRTDSKKEMSLPCRFLQSIISCIEEVATGQCGPEAKPMFCKFFQLAPFQAFLVGDRKGIAEELRNCPKEITHCKSEDP